MFVMTEKFVDIDLGHANKTMVDIETARQN